MKRLAIALVLVACSPAAELEVAPQCRPGLEIEEYSHVRAPQLPACDPAATLRDQVMKECLWIAP